MQIKVLFVCLGNICRSPTAEGVFRQTLKQAGLEHRVLIDSCGTGSWHIGAKPDARTIKAAAQYGYDLSGLRARQICREDFDYFDYILAMDKQNLNDLKAMSPPNFTGCLGLFLDFADTRETEVPDPYYGTEQGFTAVLNLVEKASLGLLQAMINND